MTVSNVSPRTAPVAVAAGVDTYTFLFPVLDAAHVKVHVVSAAGATRVLASADYTTTLVAAPQVGGSVQVSAALAVGESVVLVRETPDTQATDLPAQGPFSLSTLERDLDRRTMISQEQGVDIAALDGGIISARVVEVAPSGDGDISLSIESGQLTLTYTPPVATETGIREVRLEQVDASPANPAGGLSRALADGVITLTFQPPTPTTNTDTDTGITSVVVNTVDADGAGSLAAAIADRELTLTFTPPAAEAFLDVDDDGNATAPAGKSLTIPGNLNARGSMNRLRGILLTTDERDAITDWEDGEQIINTTLDAHQVRRDDSWHNLGTVNGQRGPDGATLSAKYAFDSNVDVPPPGTTTTGRAFIQGTIAAARTIRLALTDGDGLPRGPFFTGLAAPAGDATPKGHVYLASYNADETLHGWALFRVDGVSTDARFVILALPVGHRQSSSANPLAHNLRVNAFFIPASAPASVDLSGYVETDDLAPYALTADIQAPPTDAHIRGLFNISVDYGQNPHQIPMANIDALGGISITLRRPRTDAQIQALITEGATVQEAGASRVDVENGVVKFVKGAADFAGTGGGITITGAVAGGTLVARNAGGTAWNAIAPSTLPFLPTGTKLAGLADIRVGGAGAASFLRFQPGATADASRWIHSRVWPVSSAPGQPLVSRHDDNIEFSNRSLLPAVNANDAGKVAKVNTNGQWVADTDNTGTGGGGSTTDARGSGFKYRRTDALTTSGGMSLTLTSGSGTTFDLRLNNNDVNGQTIASVVALTAHPDGLTTLAQGVYTPAHALVRIYDATRDRLFVGRITEARNYPGYVRVRGMSIESDNNTLPSSTSDCYVSITGPFAQPTPYSRRYKTNGPSQAAADFRFPSTNNSGTKNIGLPSGTTLDSWEQITLTLAFRPEGSRVAGTNSVKVPLDIADLTGCYTAGDRSLRYERIGARGAENWVLELTGGTPSGTWDPTYTAFRVRVIGSNANDNLVPNWQLFYITGTRK